MCQAEQQGITLTQIQPLLFSLRNANTKQLPPATSSMSHWLTWELTSAPLTLLNLKQEDL